MLYFIMHSKQIISLLGTKMIMLHGSVYKKFERFWGSFYRHSVFCKLIANLGNKIILFKLYTQTYWNRCKLITKYTILNRINSFKTHCHNYSMSICLLCHTVGIQCIKILYLIFIKTQLRRIMSTREKMKAGCAWS